MIRLTDAGVVQFSQMCAMRRLSCALIAAMTLAGCGPNEERRAAMAEQKRTECLDRICDGDVEPKRDMATEVALKLNGQWYIGPKEYFNGYDGRTGFEWWNHKPVSAHMKRPAEMQALAVDGKGYDFTIEIFLSTPKISLPGKSMYQTLLEMETNSVVLEKRNLRPGLQVWRTRENGRLPETWYVATALKEPGGDPPTIACRGDDPAYYRCNTGFRWLPDVAASMRFRAIHGPDWPEIYLETVRVLNLLRKA